MTNYGKEVAVPMIKLFLTDAKFVKENISHIHPNDIDNDILREIFGKIKDFYGLPTHSELCPMLWIKNELHTDDEIRKQEYKAWMEKIENTVITNDLRNEVDATLDMLEVEAGKKRLKESLNGGSNTDIKNACSRYENALTKSQRKSLPITIEEAFERFKNAPKIERIPTGIQELDEVMYGGMQKKGVGLLIAGTNVGKSTLFSIMAVNAAKMGYKVLHIFFEDEYEDMYKKYAAHLKNKSLRDITVDDCIALPTLRLWKMENEEGTVEQIAEEVKDADIVFVDYLSCIKYDRKNEYSELESIMRKFETLSSKKNIAIWVAQQTNREGAKMDATKTGMDKVQGSFRITQPAKTVIYLDNKGCDKDRVIFHIEKNKGNREDWDNAYFNTNTCQIDLSNRLQTNSELEVVL